MAKLQKEIQGLDQRLAEPSLYLRDPTGAAFLAKDRSDAEKRLARSEEDWLALSADYEKASAGPE